jgi:EcsC family protein
VSEPDDIGGVGRPPESLLERLRAEPERAPEHIALAAAERFGPQAERWVALWQGHEPDKLARIAHRKHVRLSRVEGAALGLGGVFTMVPDLVALAWIQSRMVFYIAAAYGYDPNHPMRPAELLAIQGVYPTAAEAREALDGVGKHLAIALAEKGMQRDERTLVERLTRYLIRRATRRVAGRWIPFIGAPIGAVQNGNATSEIGLKARRFYGGERS